MFPVGGAGLGLLILRLCAAGMLLRNPMLKSTVEIPFWAAAGLIVIAISLCIGAFTPLSCIASGVAQIAMLSCKINQGLFELRSLSA
jgi:integral membrane sensor domain MASE1